MLPDWFWQACLTVCGLAGLGAPAIYSAFRKLDRVDSKQTEFQTLLKVHIATSDSRHKEMLDRQLRSEDKVAALDRRVTTLEASGPVSRRHGED